MTGLQAHVPEQVTLGPSRTLMTSGSGTSGVCLLQLVGVLQDSITN